METTPTRTSTITTTGTSKVTPNAMKVVSTKERYLSISVIHATPSGAMDAMNLKTTGYTRKYAKDIPYVLYQVWAFVAPGLNVNEKRLVLALVIRVQL